MKHEDPDLHAERVDYESKSLTRPEYISAIVHLYRGELHRATVWRLRLDNTTNWSIITTAGMLSFAFDGREHSHWVLLTGILLLTSFLSIEARRFRFFDVWRYRVRRIEENFYGPILQRDPVSPDSGWGDRVAEDLLHPVFKISYRAALRARFIRNYWVLYLVLLGGWMLKVLHEPEVAQDFDGLKQNLQGNSVVPWQVPIAIFIVVVVVMIVTVLFFPKAPLNEESYWSQKSDSHYEREIGDLDV
ncbi:hypothetical protein DRQ53_13095 [bacterium]|nr:MAG: hypothetical protein DRQ32_08660 [bacterium]RKZ13587.1 MAG: hypothetical protein DRQ53_13095 [bacterium]